MNKQIKELIEQAGFEEKDGHISIQGVYMFNTTRMEKLAELIVREVFAKIEDERFEIYQPVKESVMKHFGVEE